ncbi:MAG: DUF4760 domain-containing protein [Pseudomonadota bacterium]
MAEIPLWKLALGPVAGAFITALAAYFITQLTLHRQQQLALKRATIDFLEARNRDDSYRKLRAQLIDIVSNRSISTEQWADADNDTSPERHAIRDILNDHELMAVGISTKIFDENTCKEYLRAWLLEDMKDLMPFVHAFRKRTNDNTTYVYAETLANKWRNSS